MLFLDRARAKVQFEWFSAFCVAYPKIGRHFTPVRWYLTNQHADRIDWRLCNGDPHASRFFPAHFTEGVMLETTETSPPFDRQLAAAFPVGKAVVAAVIPGGASQVIMGVGRGEKVPLCDEPQFRGTIGALDAREFIQDNTVRGIEVGAIAALQRQFPEAQRV